MGMVITVWSIHPKPHMATLEFFYTPDTSVVHTHGPSEMTRGYHMELCLSNCDLSALTTIKMEYLFRKQESGLPKAQNVG